MIDDDTRADRADPPFVRGLQLTHVNTGSATVTCDGTMGILRAMEIETRSDSGPGGSFSVTPQVE